MAFLRDYAEQGDPVSRTTLRAGQLKSRRRLARPAGGRLKRQLSHQARMRALYEQGDPFRFRLPKFVRKLSLKGIASTVGKLAKVALPIALPFIGGPLGMVAGALAGGRASAGSPDEPAPETTYDAPLNGTLGEVYRRESYQVPGIEVEVPRYQEPEDDYSDEDDYSAVDEAGEDEDYSDEYEGDN